MREKAKWFLNINTNSKPVLSSSQVEGSGTVEDVGALNVNTEEFQKKQFGSVTDPHEFLNSLVMVPAPAKK